jgi:hypothetical protein
MGQFPSSAETRPIISQYCSDVISLYGACAYPWPRAGRNTIALSPVFICGQDVPYLDAFRFWI